MIRSEHATILSMCVKSIESQMNKIVEKKEYHEFLDQILRSVSVSLDIIIVMSDEYCILLLYNAVRRSA